MWRVGVRGYNGSSHAGSLDEVTAAVDCLWVETPSGARIDGSELSGVTFRIEPDHPDADMLGRTTLEFTYGSVYHAATLEALGGFEIEYLGRDGEPLT